MFFNFKWLMDDHLNKLYLRLNYIDNSLDSISTATLMKLADFFDQWKQIEDIDHSEILKSIDLQITIIEHIILTTNRQILSFSKV
jgi:hypothetical protein